MRTGQYQVNERFDQAFRGAPPGGGSTKARFPCRGVHEHVHTGEQTQCQDIHFQRNRPLKHDRNWRNAGKPPRNRLGNRLQTPAPAPAPAPAPPQRPATPPPSREIEALTASFKGRGQQVQQLVDVVTQDRNRARSPARQVIMLSACLLALRLSSFHDGPSASLCGSPVRAAAAVPPQQESLPPFPPSSLPGDTRRQG